MSQYIIGLTGGIGSGKTAASDYFEKLGIVVVDADVVAREVVEPGKPALTQIADHFGADILTTDGQLDRRQLREIIFKDPKAKTWLESLLHPLIRDEIIAQLTQAKSAYAILVSPLLFETNQHELVKRTLLIDVPEDTQVERASQRDDANDEQIKSIIAAQMSRSCKRDKADDIIVNDRDLAYLYQQIDAQHAAYLSQVDSE